MLLNNKVLYWNEGFLTWTWVLKQETLNKLSGPHTKESMKVGLGDGHENGQNSLVNVWNFKQCFLNLGNRKNEG